MRTMFCIGGVAQLHVSSMSLHQDNGTVPRQAQAPQKLDLVLTVSRHWTYPAHGVEDACQCRIRKLVYRGCLTYMI